MNATLAANFGLVDYAFKINTQQQQQKPPGNLFV